MNYMKNRHSNIPKYVINWTDKYFHQSAFDAPVNNPSKNIIEILSRFNKPNIAKLYRGVNEYNKNDKRVVSWTYDRRVAKRYINKMSDKIIEAEFPASKILLDTTFLTRTEKRQLGYDYKVDDKEVLILNI
ncbi:MAG: hypothetical protein UW30_C0015G0011 [Candidatus Giovannonibacteria bacterium GW2011_GWA2_44_13b]|uniref:Uncharacterized protein n=2 Tax=Candidatus Giovannoniibacteriota TaxID=1752738 RepID=A0A0G1H248_9BACT|nr:MAG: hypothetical protein UW30_C0015G0011 [Candidatus Giovannonibacteria bacterium GW2011_GWA2_44_13b]OGF82449.1 MAG: hypothetical protein A2924_01170 [Candidatus Giovannonibacteria bacterium RIFCSPLOWO2_01_FULL_44_16]